MPESLRKAVLDTARRTLAAGLNHGTSGNVSARTGSLFFITPTGVPYETLAPGDLATVDVDGGPNTGPAPSSEWPMHQAIYRARPDAAAIVHTHSAAASAFACLNRDLPAFHYMIAVAGGDSVRAARYAVFGSAALGEAAVDALDGRLACFLAHHGLVAVGATLERAFAVAVEVEYLADLYLRLLPAGMPEVLPADLIAEVLERFTRYGPEAR